MVDIMEQTTKKKGGVDSTSDTCLYPMYRIHFKYLLW